jgi:hypothetical protein
MSNPLLNNAEQAHLDSVRALRSNSHPTLALPSPETANAAYMHITNVTALVLTAYIAYETKQALTPHVGNIPVLIAGSFPIVASTAIAVLTFFSEKNSLLRIFYLMGIYTSSWLGV